MKCHKKMIKEECKPIAIKKPRRGFIGIFMLREIEAVLNVKVPAIMVEYDRVGDA